MRGAAAVPGLFPTSLEVCFAPVRIPKDPKKSWLGSSKRAKTPLGRACCEGIGPR